MISSTVSAELVTDVRAAIDSHQYGIAESMVQRGLSQNGPQPEVLEAMSWLGRAALAAKQYDKAESYAGKTQTLVLEQLKHRKLDAEPHLPLALGAAIEVEAQAKNAQGDRGGALAFLQQEMALYKGTSIRARIQKNINLLDLVGKPAPVLDEHEFLGPKPPTLAALRGKPVLLFFWAHWCGDCKLERKEISQIRREFPGLALIGPTQLYGYMAKGEDATPKQELTYIDEVRRKYYADLSQMPAPVSEENMKRYGVSTSPTLVLIDKRGIVRMYHPGAMTAAELRAAIQGAI